MIASLVSGSLRVVVGTFAPVLMTGGIVQW
jgi:hypothetical protein